MQADIVNFFHDTQLMWGLIIIGFSFLFGLRIFGKRKKSRIFREKQSQKLLETALKDFNEKDKEMFVLALDGVKSEEISKRLNIQENLIKQTVGKIILKGK